MAELKVKPSPVALIGDIVESRTHRERQALHEAFEAAVGRANAEVPIDDPAVITVGDEFQGVYPTLGAALRASFLVRAELLPVADIRFGLGRGDVTTLDPVRGIHDGPAYWAAREAITLAEDRAQRAQTRTSRTAYVAPYEPPAHRGGRAGRARLSGLHGWLHVDHFTRDPRRTHARPRPARRGRTGRDQPVRGVAARAAGRHRDRPRGDGDARGPAVTWLSIVLAGIGVGDILRSTSWRHGALVGHVAAPVVILGLGLVAGMHDWPDLLALIVAAA